MQKELNLTHSFIFIRVNNPLEKERKTIKVRDSVEWIKKEIFALKFLIVHLIIVI